MGVSHSFNLINPKRFNELYELFSNMQTYDNNIIKELYVKYNVKFDESYFDEIFEEYQNSEYGDLEELIKQNFDELITEKYYLLYRTFDKINFILENIPEFKPINFLLKYEKFNIEVPKNIDFYFGSGIVGIWSYNLFIEYQDLIEKLCDLEYIKNYKKSKSYSFFEKMFKKKKIETALQYWTEEDVLSNMKSINKTLNEAINKKYYVGFEQNT